MTYLYLLLSHFMYSFLVSLPVGNLRLVFFRGLPGLFRSFVSFFATNKSLFFSS